MQEMTELVNVFAKTEFVYGTVSEKLSLCGQMVLTGMGTVFLVLLILWGIIAIFGLVSKTGEKKAKKAAEPVTPAEEPAESADSADDGELIAVITAAIEAYRAAEGKTGAYRVVSFKRNTGRKSWNKNNED